MTTFASMVNSVRSNLTQDLSVLDQRATFNGWVTDGGGAIVGYKLSDLAGNIAVAGVDVELASGELLYLKSIDTQTGIVECPAWFRGQNGTPQDDTVETGTLVRIRPQWPTWSILRQLVAGVRAMHPPLFGVAEQDLTTSVTAGQYVLDPNVDQVLRVDVEGYAPRKQRLPVQRWRLDKVNNDGNVYLHTPDLAVPSRPLTVTYSRSPVLPDLTDPTAVDHTWADTLMPASAMDLPILYATGHLLLSLDATRLMTGTMEQQDKSQFVQGNPASTAARRYLEEFERRLARERAALARFYPPKPHRE